MIRLANLATIIGSVALERGNISFSKCVGMSPK